MIIFIRAYSISKDSRLLKYISICNDNCLDYKVIGWDKDCSEESSSECTYYRGNFGIGKKWKNILAILKWWFYILRVVIHENKNSKVKVIHSVDLDCGIIALLISKLVKAKHIYDIYDVYSANRNMRGVVKSVVNVIERFICRNSTYFIMPEIFRFEQLQLNSTDSRYKNFVEIENVPDIKEIKESISYADNCFHLVYAGSLEPKHRGIENLLQAVSVSSNIVLDIAGIGPLTDMCINYSQKFDNIHFHGGVSPQQVYELEAKSQIVVGMYYRTRDNHQYASPNKYYEHLALGKVMLTTSGTPPGFKVEKNKTGFAIGESTQDILNLFNSLEYNIPLLEQYSLNAHIIWSQNYSDYNEKYLTKQYIKMVG